MFLQVVRLRLVHALQGLSQSFWFSMSGMGLRTAFLKAAKWWRFCWFRHHTLRTTRMYISCCCHASAGITLRHVVCTGHISVWAAIISCHRLGGLITEMYFLIVLEPRSPRLGFQPAPLSTYLKWLPSHYVLKWPFLCTHISLVPFVLLARIPV